METKYKFKELLLTRGCNLNSPSSNRRYGHFLCQDYQDFLYTISDGVKNRDEDGWKFWGADSFKTLNEVKTDYGQYELSVELNPECYVVFADYLDGRKFLCFRMFRPNINFPIIHINHGMEIKPYATNFETLVENYKTKHGY